MVQARIKEYSIDEIVQAIESINNSSFLKGQNKNNWIITFDWFIKPNNFVKVLEGNYLDKEASNGKPRTNDNPDTEDHWGIEKFHHKRLRISIMNVKYVKMKNGYLT